MSTIKVNTIDTQSGTAITVPTGKVFTITDAGGISIAGTAVTASGAELNKLAGVTATAAEFNYLDITTLGTSEDSKAVTQASSVVTIGAAAGNQVLNVASHDLVDGGLKLAGTLVTSSAAELNLMDGVTASTAELNVLDGIPAGLTATEIGYSDGVTSAIQTQIGTLLPLAGGTMTGETVFADQLVTRPKIKDYSESYTATSGTGTVDLDMVDGNVFQHTASGGNVTFTFSSPSAAGTSCAFTLKWIQDSTDRTATWPASVDWAAATAPTLTSGSAKVDVFTFFTVDGGTIWYGFVAGQDMS